MNRDQITKNVGARVQLEPPARFLDANDAQRPAEQPVAAESAASSPEDRLTQAIAERDVNFDKWKRAQADLENYRRRVQRDIDEVRRYEGLSLARDLLPVLDNLERAVVAAETSQNAQELSEGVRMVMKQFEDALAAHSVVPIEPAGKPFDPHRHEAIQQLPSAEHEPMTVMQEVQRGYILNDRVVRPSQVIVSSGPPPELPAREEGDSQESADTTEP